MVNLLELALPILTNVVPPGEFKYRTYLGSTLNEMGVSVPSYSSWKPCVGSVQPMDAKTRKMFGIDAATRGILVWGSINFNTLDVQDHPDQVLFMGRIFNCDHVTPWGWANGWHAFGCTEDKRERKDTATAKNPMPAKDESSGEKVGTVAW